MKFCSQCGQQLPDEARFSYICGAAIVQRKPESQCLQLQSPKDQQTVTASKPESENRPVVSMPPEKPRSPIEQPPPRGQLPMAAPIQSEPAPPVPPQGLTFTWQRTPKGHVVPVVPVRPGTEQTQRSTKTENAALPAGSAMPDRWKFRERTTAWADTLTAGLKNSVSSKDHPVLNAVVRLVQGALLHLNVYRTTAQRPDVNTEAFCIAACIIVAGFAALSMTGLGAWVSGIATGLLVRVAVGQIVAWGCALFAIQAAARSLYQIQFPIIVWFRGLIYAQAPALLSFVPGFGTVCDLWTDLCTVAAVHDLTGRNTAAAITLTLIGAVASAIGAYIVTFATG
jgi:hypothetical protein